MKVNFGRYPKDHSKERKIKVEVRDYDVLNADHTLALIIHPVLLKLKEQKHGSGAVDDTDVPEELKSTSCTISKENDWDTDSLLHKRWDHVLDEMIWSFAEHCRGDDMLDQFWSESPTQVWGVFDKDAYIKYEEKLANGRRLFAKYYGSLWD